MAALLERRMERIDEVGYSLLPIGVVLGGVVALVLAEPDLGTAVCIVMIAAVMIFAAGISYRYVVGLILVVAAGRLPAGGDLGLPLAAGDRLPRSVGRSARRRLADDPVDDRRRHRRHLRPRD